MLGFMFVFSLIGMGLSSLLFGVDMTADPDYSNYRTLQSLKFQQALVSLGGFLAPVFVFVKLRKYDFGKLTLISQPMEPNRMMVVTILTVGAFPLIGALSEWNQSMVLPDSFSWLEELMLSSEQRAERLIKAFLEHNSSGDLMINLVVMAVLPALAEELLFRGTVQPILIRRFGNVHTGIWVTAALFSAIHFQFYGFVPRMILGAVFGYLVVYGGSLRYSIWAHFINNGLAVYLMFLISRKSIPEETETIGAHDGQWWMVLASLMLVVTGLYYFWSRRPSGVNNA
ncbi:CPBP family intramembrane metalloprotease [bacterium SCSIO 12741]|nr:CPBP family intramembrane metalloprotease [bacterium SCSIO 12741]